MFLDSPLVYRFSLVPFYLVHLCIAEKGHCSRFCSQHFVDQVPMLGSHGYIWVPLIGLSGLPKKQIKHEIGRWTFVGGVGKDGRKGEYDYSFCIHAYNFN